MNNRFIDQSTNRKNTIVKNNLKFINDFPLFSILEFNITGNCNRDCSFCPVSNPEVYIRSNDAISPELFEKITLDLKEINYSGKILFSAFSEPLLHKEIEKLISTARKNLQNCRIEIVSNGDLVTAKKLKKLYDAGLDTINISMYDGKHQIDIFENMQKESEVPKDFVVLRRRYWENGNYGITISNRAGLIDSNEFRDKNEEKILELPIKEKCFYPFYMILVDLNGDVLLCPHDWKKSVIFGNLQNENILDIWRGKKLETMRKNLSNSNRNFTPCKTCDVLGTVMGKESFKAWNKI
ncbi:radical SAM superfamily enzyme [Thiovulum sp. ES]|nr:radical SAM superfamily enzyme [Thiovulum sp. ES]